jgi:hypothetical protein
MTDSVKVMNDIDTIKESLDGMDVVEKILKIKKYFEDTPVEDWQMDRMTDYMMILCTLMYNLSDLKDYAYIKAEALGEEYKATVRDEYLALKKSEEKMTDTMAKSTAEQRCDEIKEMQMKADYQARQLRSLYDDCDRLISYSQSKIKSISDSVIRSKIERK